MPLRNDRGSVCVGVLGTSERAARERVAVLAANSLTRRAGQDGAAGESQAACGIAISAEVRITACAWERDSPQQRMFPGISTW